MEDIEILRIFLKKNRKITIFRKYRKNFNNCSGYCNYSNFIIRTNKSISSSFSWSSTKEGYYYWNKLNLEWLELCENFELKGKIDLNKV